MLLLLSAVAVACLSCVDRDPVAAAPGETLPSLVAAESSPMLEGCARFQVEVSGRDGVRVNAEAAPECGPIRPVLAGEPAFDRTARTLRLPIALENAGTRKVKAPAWLVGWEDSLEVIAPRGLVRNGHTAGYLSLAGADSVVADSAAELPGARLFAYDTLLAHADSAQRLAGGDTSRVRWIELRVHPGVERFSATFHARARRASPPVPPVPPDTLPAWVLNPDALAPDAIDDTRAFRGGRILKNLVGVVFRSGTPQSVKEDAVDAISGEVIGGDRWGDRAGIYYVTIPHDGSSAPLARAIEQLERLPSVETTIAYYVDGLFSTSYASPEDGNGWKEWQIDPDGANGDNWGLEAVNGPFAWGCATGEQGETVPVAVVDNGIHSGASDLFHNVTKQSGVGLFPNQQHGNAVASILAARGNNAAGMTGMIWKADLRLYDAAVDPSGNPLYTPGSSEPHISQVPQALFRAIADSAAVVNLSISLNWAQITGNNSNPHSAADSVKVKDAVRILLSAVRWGEAESGPSRALLVVAAGNDNIDAYWSGVAALADSLPQRVLVVGSIRNHSNGTAWARDSDSNHGSRVDLMAPGQRVRALNKNGSVIDTTGTSFAAPYVSGAAALLRSFDPTLTAEDLHRLLVEGARQGGRRVHNPSHADSIPVLNAYESLKLAARRPGAPLCGNRLWATGDGHLHVQRDTTPGAPAEVIDVSQVLGSADPVLISNADVLHGGRQVRLRTGVRGQRGIRWTPTGWVADATLSGRWTDHHPGSSGAYLSATHTSSSKYARSHGADTLLHGALAWTGRDLHLTLAGPAGTIRQTTLPGVSRPGAWDFCIVARKGEGDAGCLLATLVPSDGESTAWSWGFSPAGERAVAVGSRVRTRGRMSGWTDCGPFRRRVVVPDGDPTTPDTMGIVVVEGEAECRSYRYDVSRAGAEFHVLSVPKLERQATWTLSGATAELQGISEDGAEMAVEAVTGSVTWAVHWDTQDLAVKTGTVANTSACRVRALGMDAALTPRWEGPNCFGQSVTPTIAPERQAAREEEGPAAAPAQPQRPGWGTAARLALLRMLS